MEWQDRHMWALAGPVPSAVSSPWPPELAAQSAAPPLSRAMTCRGGASANSVHCGCPSQAAPTTLPSAHLRDPPPIQDHPILMLLPGPSTLTVRPAQVPSPSHVLRNRAFSCGTADNSGDGASRRAPPGFRARHHFEKWQSLLLPSHVMSSCPPIKPLAHEPAAQGEAAPGPAQLILVHQAMGEGEQRQARPVLVMARERWTAPTETNQLSQEKALACGTCPFPWHQYTHVAEVKLLT